MGSSSQSEDEFDDLKSALLDRIAKVHGAGLFATSKSFERFPLPGIIVDQVREMSIPLTPDHASSLIQQSPHAPFGKGDQTVVDEEVRKTWEIDGKNVSFSNKLWHGWLKDVVSEVARELGVAGDPDNVRADLHKMLLYDKGAMFKPHKEYVNYTICFHPALIPRSTERAVGMLGTLVICLPSKHVGGRVCLKHGNQKITFNTDKWSDFNMSYIAWHVCQIVPE
jgi:hypothetical protein